ncbi:Sporulation and spore germination [Clostridiales bacterium CHKCI001]|nr:Sporulation and spore germination [Clostridiales bacterium CHKCI001]
MKQWWIVLILLICCLLSGCSENETQRGNEYLIYGLKNGATRLETITYKTDTTDTQELIEEIMNQFLNLNEKDVVSVLPKKEWFHDYKLENKILCLDFYQDYQTMDTVQEVLCRGAFVMTFMQVNGIESVSITVNDQPLVDKNGNPVQTQKESDFIDIIGKGLNSASEISVTLYFSNKTGNSLVKRVVEVTYDSSYILERIVLNCLIQGPEDDSCITTLPSNLKILGVSVKDGTCYVNLDKSFLTETMDVEAYIPVYSIVNSLAELPGVQRVQILVDGKSDIMFQDVISLKEPLERKLEYIGGSSN